MPILVRARPARTRPRHGKVGVYSDPGVGKTQFAGTAEDCSDLVSSPIFFDIEGGTMTIADRNMPVLTITKWSEIQEAYTDLFNMCYSPTYDGPKYDMAIIDSMTELQKILMVDLMKEVKLRDADRDVNVPSKREWGIANEMMRKLTRAFRNLPIHVVFIFLAKEDRDDQTGEIKVRPSLPGKLATEIAGFLDVLGYMYVAVEDELGPDGKPTGRKSSVRKMLVQPTAKYSAKDRSNKLGLGIRNPTMRDILGPILQVKAAMTDEEVAAEEKTLEEGEELELPETVVPEEADIPA